MLEPSFPGDHSGLAPPDSISNSVVKRTSAYDSVVFHHVKVGHRQDFYSKSSLSFLKLLFFALKQKKIKSRALRFTSGLRCGMT